MTQQLSDVGKWVGKEIPNYEHIRMVRGRGWFVDDIQLPNMLYAAILRSPYAHARIVRIDTSKALENPGVFLVLTGEDIARLTNPFPQIVGPPEGEKIKDYCMAVGKVRYYGEPVAVVVADDKYKAYDALEMIDVEYEPLPAVVDGEKALEPSSPLVHDDLGSNIVWHGVFNYGDIESAFQEADVIIEEKLHFHRYSVPPLETNSVVADYDSQKDVLTIYANNQMPMVVGFMISVALNRPLSRIRFVVPDVGGAFGTKINNYVYMTLIGLLAQILKRPVKWTETRRENLAASSSHCNERKFLVKAAFKKDGTLLAIDAKAIDDIGAYPRYEPLGAVIWAQVSPNVYRFKNLRVDFYTVVTNKCPTGPVRGYSRLQHMWMIERIMDAAAKKLGIDVSEIRLKNFIRADEMPYETPSGGIYDGGDYVAAFKKLLDLIGYEKWREIQVREREKGKLIGIGVGCTIDSGSNNFGQVKIINPHFPISHRAEAAWVKIDHMGNIIAALSSCPSGQGHETFAKQLLAEEFGVTPDAVTVLSGFDSFANPGTAHAGTYASAAAVLNATALLTAAKRVKDKLLAIAAHVLEARVEDLKLEDGEVKVAGTDKSLPLWMVANIAWSDLWRLPEGMEPGLYAHAVYTPEFNIPDPQVKKSNQTLTYSYQFHAAVVEIDPETGAVQILDYAIVDDCGRMINPLTVKGQVLGSAFNAISAALYEAFVYDENGQLLNDNFTDYLAPTAVDVPMITKVEHFTTPSLKSPLGTRGVGEGGGSPLAAICSAVEDAIQQYFARKSHLTPQDIWQQVNSNSKKVKN